MITKKQAGSLIIRILIVAAAAVILQLVLWNSSNWLFLIDNTVQKNIVFELEDFKSENWIEQDDKMISLSDPMLIMSGLNMYIRRVQIKLDIDSLPPYLQLYYTNTDHPDYNGETVVTASQPDSIILIDVNADVKDLRIDIGDDPETILHHMTVIVNPVQFHFSVAVVMATILIYLSAKLLFHLQHAPIYNLPNMQSDNEREDDA